MQQFLHHTWSTPNNKCTQEQEILQLTDLPPPKNREMRKTARWTTHTARQTTGLQQECNKMMKKENDWLVREKVTTKERKFGTTITITLSSLSDYRLTADAYLFSSFLPEAGNHIVISLSQRKLSLIVAHTCLPERSFLTWEESHLSIFLSPDFCQLRTILSPDSSFWRESVSQSSSLHLFILNSFSHFIFATICNSYPSSLTSSRVSLPSFQWLIVWKEEDGKKNLSKEIKGIDTDISFLPWKKGSAKEGHSR